MIGVSGRTVSAGQRATLLLLAAAGLVGFVAYGQSWVTVTEAVPGLPATVRALSGRDLAPGAGYLPLLLLVAPLAVWATGGWLRRVVGAVALLAGLAVAWAAVQAAPPLLDTGRLSLGPDAGYTESAWWLLAAGAGVLAALAGLVVAWRSGSWPRMAGRYERTRGPARERSAWELLDAGLDPTDAPDAPGAAGLPGSGDGPPQPSGTMAHDGRPERGSET